MEELSLPIHTGPRALSRGQQRSLRAGISFLILITGYGLYATCVVPVIELVGERPPPAPRHTEKALPLAHHKLFQTEDWELTQANNVLQTKRAMVLANEMEQVDEQRIHLVPCTIIFQDTAAEQVFVLRAMEGAYLVFEGDSDLHMGQAELASAELLGEIRIFRADLSTGEQDISIRTRHLQMNPQQIWTSHKVDMRWNGSVASGTGLVINLQDPNSLASEDESGPIQRIRSLGLDSLETFRVDLTKRPPPGTSQQAETEPPRWLDLRCQGRMWINVPQRVVTLDRQVNVFHHMDNQLSEQLSCDVLSLNFELSQPDDQQDETDRSAVGANFTVREIVATGFPVIADMPAHDSWARSDRLTYHPVEQRVVLEARGDKPVEIEYQGRRLRTTQRIDYQWTIPGRPGRLNVDGAGEYQGPLAMDDQGSTQAVVRWQRGLQLHRPNGQLTLSLRSDAQGPPVTISGAQLGTLQAASVDLELDEIERVPSAADVPAYEIRPARFLARGEATLQSRQVEVQCQTLEARVVAAASSPPQVDGPVLAPATDANRGRAASQPRERPQDRWVIHGQAVQLAWSEPTGGQKMDWEPQEAIVEGAADIQQHPRQPNQKPLRLRGDRLVVRRPRTPQGFVQLRGQPGRIDYGELVLQADEIQWSARQNMTAIPGPGRVFMPIPDAHALAASGPVELNWERQATFDGRRAIFFGGTRRVSVKSALQMLLAQRIEVLLDRSIMPTDADRRGTKPEIQELRALGSVAFENREMQEGKLSSIHRGALPNIRANLLTGDVHGDGPGWMSMVGFGQADAMVSAPGLRTTTRPEKLVYTRIGYQQAVEGNLHEQQILFRGDVEAARGPVATWGDVIDVDSLHGLSQEDAWLECQQLTVARLSPRRSQETPIEATATGNVLVRSDRFSAEGNRLAYNQLKDRVILEGTRRRVAMLTQRPANGGTPQTFQSRRILFFPNTGEVQADFKRLEFGNIPGLPAPRDLRP